MIISTGWRWKLIFSGICLGLALILQILARKTEWFGEFYACRIYPLWERSLGRLMAFVPVSVTEVFIYIIVVVFMFSLVRILFFRKGYCWVSLGKGCLTILVLASFLFALYTLNCGVNYYRKPFSEVEGFEVRERPVEELYSLCLKLTEDVNTYSGQMIRNRWGVSIMETNVNERAARVMTALGEQYASLSGYYPKAKPLIFSQILSWQQLSGVYSPFTIEANYNRHMTAYNIPFTACHELSHLKGFMREDEANFIAYLACMSSDEIDFKYSGSLLGWIYATNALKAADEALYQEITAQLNEEVWSDLKANSEFWDRYEGRVAEISDKVNDTYLKANDQADGVKSYDRFVDLMLALMEEE